MDILAMTLCCCTVSHRDYTVSGLVGFSLNQSSTFFLVSFFGRHLQTDGEPGTMEKGEETERKKEEGTC